MDIYTPHIDKKGATMIELMVALAILSLGITALLQALGSGMRYAKDTEDNVKAINIAREGIEAMINIRDTNWLRFSSDRANCWKSKDYRSGCIGNTNDSDAINKLQPGRYTLYMQNGVWFLSGITSPANHLSAWSTYKNQFRVGIDSGGFFTQSGVSNTACSSALQASCQTIFTREIKLTAGSNSGELFVESTTRWNLERPREVRLETMLTNWKSRF